MAPVRPGDMIETTGKVTIADEKTGKLVLQIVSQNQEGEKVISAKCTLRAQEA